MRAGAIVRVTEKLDGVGLAPQRERYHLDVESLIKLNIALQPLDVAQIRLERQHPAAIAHQLGHDKREKTVVAAGVDRQVAGMQRPRHDVDHLGFRRQAVLDVPHKGNVRVRLFA